MDAAVRLSVMGIVGEAWGRLRGNFLRLWGYTLVVVLIFGVAQTVVGMLSDASTFLGIVASLGVMVLQFVLVIGWTRVLIKITRGEPTEIADLYRTEPGQIVSYFAASLISGIGIIVGLLFFVVPGIYLALRWAMSPYLIVDRNVGAMESLDLSGKMTEGVKLRMLGIGIVSWLLIMLGFFLLIIGLVVMVPWVWMIGTLMYTTLLDTSEKAVVGNAETLELDKPEKSAKKIGADTSNKTKAASKKTETSKKST